MSARALAPDGSRLVGLARCRHRATSRPKATPPRAAAAENPVVSAALGTSSRVRDALPAAGPEAERPAAAQPPTASAAAREAAEWQEWQDVFQDVDAKDRLSEALRVRAAGARPRAHTERVHAVGAAGPPPGEDARTEPLSLAPRVPAGAARRGRGRGRLCRCVAAGRCAARAARRGRGGVPDARPGQRRCGRTVRPHTALQRCGASSAHSSLACCTASPTLPRCVTRAPASWGGGTAWSRQMAAPLATRTGAFCVSHPPTDDSWAECTHRSTLLTCTAALRRQALARRQTLACCVLSRRWSFSHAVKPPLRLPRAMKHAPL